MSAPHADAALRAIERDAAAGEVRRIDAAEDEVGVGHRRMLAATSIAGGTGLRARALRADRDAAHGIDMGDGAAAGADLDHLDHGNAQGKPAALHETVAPVDLEGARGLGLRSPRSGRSWRWCRPCRRKAPSDAALARQMAGEDRAARRAALNEADRKPRARSAAWSARRRRSSDRADNGSPASASSCSNRSR